MSVCVCSCVCTCIRSGLPVLGRRRWASLWMCSGSPAPISRNPWLCLATGAGSLWTQKAACSSGRWGKKEYGFKTWRLSTPHACGSGELTKNKPTTIFKKKKRPPSFDLPYHWELFSNGDSMSKGRLEQDAALLMWLLAPKDSPVVTERIPYLKGHRLDAGKSQKVHHRTRALSRCSLLGPPWINLTLENCLTLHLGIIFILSCGAF